MGKKTLQQVIQENKQFGFDRHIIEIAYNNVDGNSQKILDQIFRLQSQSSQFPVKPPTAQDEQAQLSKAIEQSINQAKTKKISLQPLNPEQRVRKSGTPVGLKNIGNTCYFNSLLQTYFQNGQLVKAVLNYQTPQKYVQRADAEKNKKQSQDLQFKRKLASCKLVENLKVLFAGMIGSDRKYLDPTPVITSIVDDYGNQLPIGDQKDIGEFNLVFLSRIDQGLSLSKKQKMMDIQSSNKQLQDSPSKIQILRDQHQTSLLRRSSIILEQGSIISKQFFGKLQNSYLNEKQNISSTEQQLFSLLFVNVKHRQLYRACQQIVICNIDDYRNEKGQIVGVEKQSWIKQAPKTLFFQIDRVIFNKQKCIQQKVNTLFQFPKVFYIDPFLLKNKQKALQIQKKIRVLRASKQKYELGLKRLQNFGQKQFNLLDLLTQTVNFFQAQRSHMDEQKQSDPAFFPQLQSSVKNQHIQFIQNYKNSAEKRINSYKQKINEIEKEIQAQYQIIRSTPYHLYSILIHEGSADSGHYYSYTYDFDMNLWRKYNDVNITEQIEEKVLKEAKGLNYTSAYYLVYGQKEVLKPQDLMVPLRSNKLSNEADYGKDYFTSFMKEELKQLINKDNNHMYLQIENYKMGGYINRIIQSYTKKFQSCNQIFRKNKPQKKKNTPPLLINLPIFVKYIYDDEQYKSILIQGCIQQYGPKQTSPIFEDLIKKKLGNFNDFKKPKSLCAKPQVSHIFMSNIYCAIACKKLCIAIKQSDYQGIFGLLYQLKHSKSSQYFSWFGNLISKVLAVRFLQQAQQNTKQKSQKGLFCLKLLTLLMFEFINLKQQSNLVTNSFYWVTQIAIDMLQPFKAQAQKIATMLNTSSYQNQYQQILQSKINKTIMDEIRGSIEIQDALWNMSRKQNIYINEMLAAREDIKSKMEISNELYKQMKKYNYALTKQQRNKIKLSKL